MSQLPDPPKFPPITQYTTEAELKAITKQVFDTLTGEYGSGFDQAVTVRMLEEIGLLSKDRVRNIIGKMPPRKKGEVPEDLVPPPACENLRASGAVRSITLSWSFPAGVRNFSRFEVWRSDEDNLDSAFKVAQVYAPVYSDRIGPSKKAFYWVRAVSSKALGPFTESVFAETGMDVGLVLDEFGRVINESGILEQLTVKVDNNGYVSGYGLATTPKDDPNATVFTILADRFYVSAPAVDGIIPAAPFVVQNSETVENGVTVPPGVYLDSAFIKNATINSAKIGLAAIDDSHIANMSAAKLRAGNLDVGAYIESDSFMSGLTGFRISGNGVSEFNNIIARGTVYSNEGRFGGVVIDPNGIQSFNFSPTSGWRMDKSGSVVFNNGIFRGKLLGATGTFSGQLSAGALKTSFAKLGTAVIDGAHIQRGAIGSAQIKNAAIDSAKIKDLTVDTLNIKDWAVNTLVYATGTSPVSIMGDFGGQQIAVHTQVLLNNYARGLPKYQGGVYGAYIELVVNSSWSMEVYREKVFLPATNVYTNMLSLQPPQGLVAFNVSFNLYGGLALGDSIMTVMALGAKK